MALGMILSSFFKALGQIGDPAFRRVLLLGLGLTVGLFVALYAVLVWLLNWLVGDSATLPLIGEVHWVDNVLSWGSLPLMLLLSVVLMVPVASAFVGMFLEDVAQAVEDKHFPQLPRVPGVPFLEGLRDALNFLGIMIAANLVALVLYLLLAPAAPFIFWALNGYLLGMEAFMVAAMRRVGRAEAKKMRARHRLTLWAAGTLMAIPLSIPVMNLVVPILGAATFTHIYHKLAAKTRN